MVILDYIMPHLNGMQLYKKLKEIDNSIKAILLTGSHFQLNKDQEVQSTHDFKILTKLVTVSQLIQEVRFMLRLENENAIA